MFRQTVLAVILVVSGATSVAAQPPRALGVHGLWGAFQAPDRCYAIARPVETTGPGTDPFASVGTWPGRRVAGQFHVRLSRQKRTESAVLLRIDSQSFQLAGSGWDAWAPDARADGAIVAAMRTGLVMTVETRGRNGALIRDRYRLNGAATAVDAAALACARG